MTIFGFDLTWWQFAVIAFCAFGAGLSKTGIVGLGIVITPLMASVVSAGQAIGFMLPLYLLGDIVTISRFRSRVMWRPLRRALPWGIAGTLAGWLLAGYVGRAFGDAAERYLRTGMGLMMATIVVLGIYVSKHPEMVMSRSARLKQPGSGDVRRWYAALLGCFAGLVSMLTNSAGSIWALYFSSLGLEVREIIGTGVWCYFVLAVIKMPLNANLGFLDANTMKFNAVLAPLTVAGVFAGSVLARRFGKKMFTGLIQVLATCGALYMIFF